MHTDLSIPEKLYALQERITKISEQYGRATNTVKLLAVSKSQSDENIRIAYEAGQRLFGESYVQEALQKQEKLVDLPIEWHFIGQLQSNKAKLIAQHFSWVHSISSLSIAERLNQYHSGNLPPLNCCIQVNIGNEKTKTGLEPEQVQAFARHIIHLPNLHWRGLMTIPAFTSDVSVQRQQFSKMKELLATLKLDYPWLDTLSMGMSGDFEMAIAEGATILRIGTAIFGVRVYTHVC
ncbi:MAG: YggS family pyridoxal phosphate-dependent enzyme [Legionellales bacterium]|nr:YggS family pyridoxal phosphate-dependent enzyme [Legionellales bacterium]